MKKYYKDKDGVHFYALDEEGTALHVLCNITKNIERTQTILGGRVSLHSTIKSGTYLINNIPYWMQRIDLLECDKDEFEEALNTAIFELGIYSSSKPAESVSDVVPHMRRHLRSPKYAGVRQHAVSHMRKKLGR